MDTDAVAVSRIRRIQLPKNISSAAKEEGRPGRYP